MKSKMLVQEELIEAAQNYINELRNQLEDCYLLAERGEPLPKFTEELVETSEEYNQKLIALRLQQRVDASVLSLWDTTEYDDNNEAHVTSYM